MDLYRTGARVGDGVLQRLGWRTRVETGDRTAHHVDLHCRDVVGDGLVAVGPRVVRVIGPQLVTTCSKTASDRPVVQVGKSLLLPNVSSNHTLPGVVSVPTEMSEAELDRATFKLSAAVTGAAPGVVLKVIP